TTLFSFKFAIAARSVQRSDRNFLWLAGRLESLRSPNPIDALLDERTVGRSPALRGVPAFLPPNAVAGSAKDSSHSRLFPVVPPASGSAGTFSQPPAFGGIERQRLQASVRAGRRVHIDARVCAANPFLR